MSSQTSNIFKLNSVLVCFPQLGMGYYRLILKYLLGDWKLSLGAGGKSHGTVEKVLCLGFVLFNA